LTAATTGTGGSEIESVKSACGFVSSVISGVQYIVMIFDTAPLLLDILTGLLELVRGTRNIAAVVINGLQAALLMPAVALLLLAIKSYVS
jgi:hypothetical protein